MTRHRVALDPQEEAEHLAARRALKALVRFKLDVAKESHGRDEVIASALAVIGSAADALTAAMGSADALDLMEEHVAGLRHQANSRAASKCKGGKA